MAITVGTASLGLLTGSGGATTIAASTSATVASNGLVLAMVGWTGATTLSSVSGGGLTWTIDNVTDGASNKHTAIASAPAPSGLASGTAITATFSASSTLRVICLSSFLGSAPLVVEGVADNTLTTTAWATTGISTAGAALTVASVYCYTAASRTSTTTGPAVEISDQTPAANSCDYTNAYLIAASGGTQTIAGTWNGAITETVIAAASYKEPSSGTPWAQPVNDTLAVADSLSTAGVFSRTVGDTLTLADSLGSAGVFARAVDDTLALADSLSPQAVLQRTVDDTLTVADLVTPAGGKGASIDDTVSLSDSLTTQAVMARTVADTLTLADSLSSQAVLLRSIADTLTLADLADPVKSAGGTDHAQPIADTVAVADALTSQAVLLRTLTDSLTVADSLASSAALLRTIADTLTISDLVVTAAEALMEGFQGMFDADTERGRGSAANESDEYWLAPGGSSGSLTLTRRLTSVQSGKIEAE